MVNAVNRQSGLGAGQYPALLGVAASDTAVAGSCADEGVCSLAASQHEAKHTVLSVRSTHGLRPRAILPSSAKNTVGIKSTTGAEPHIGKPVVQLMYKTSDAFWHRSPSKRTSAAERLVSPRIRPTAGHASVQGAAGSHRLQGAVCADEQPIAATDMQQTGSQQVMRKRGTAALPVNTQLQSPAKQQLQHEWEQLQQRQQSSQHLQQQDDSYQNRLQHQVQRLQQVRNREQQEQFQLQQRRAKLYSLRSKTPSPKRDAAPPGALHAPQDASSSNNQARGKRSSQSAISRTATAADQRPPYRVGRMHGPHMQPTSDGASHPGQPAQPHQQTTGSSKAADPALASKLQVLKRSNQRLRASMQPASGLHKALVETAAAAAPAHAPDAAGAAAGSTAALGVSGSVGAHKAPSALVVPPSNESSHRKLGNKSTQRRARGLSPLVASPEQGNSARTALSASAFPKAAGTAGAVGEDAGQRPGNGTVGTSAPQLQSGLLAGLIEDALQAELAYSSPQEQQQAAADLLLEGVGSSHGSSGMVYQQQQYSREEAGSRSSNRTATDTASSISFNVQGPDKEQALQQEHPRQQQQAEEDDILKSLFGVQEGQQQHRRQQHNSKQCQQPQFQQQDQQSVLPEWRRNGSIRTALFRTPKQRSSRARRRFSSSSSSSSSESTDGSKNDSASVDRTMAEAERQLQLLLNNTGRQGPASPAGLWTSCNKLPDIAAQNAGRPQQLQERLLHGLPDRDGRLLNKLLAEKQGLAVSEAVSGGQSSARANSSSHSRSHVTAASDSAVSRPQQQQPLDELLTEGGGISTVDDERLLLEAELRLMQQKEQLAGHKGVDNSQQFEQHTRVQLQQQQQAPDDILDLSNVADDPLLLEAESCFLQLLGTSGNQLDKQQSEPQHQDVQQQQMGQPSQPMEQQRLLLQSSPRQQHSPPWRPPGIAPARSSSPNSSSKTKQVMTPRRQQQAEPWQQRTASNSSTRQQQQQQQLDLDVPDAFAEVPNSSTAYWQLAIPNVLFDAGDDSTGVDRAARGDGSPAIDAAGCIAAALGPHTAATCATSDMQLQDQRPGWGLTCATGSQQQQSQPYKSSSSRDWQQQQDPGAQAAAAHAHEQWTGPVSSGSDWHEWQQQQQQQQELPDDIPSSWLHDSRARELASSVLHEWSYQAASNNWQELMQTLDDTEPTFWLQQLQGRGDVLLGYNWDQTQYQVPPTKSAAAAAAVTAADYRTLNLCFQHWSQHAQQKSGAAALAQQQWHAYHNWRLVARTFRVWRGQALDGVLIREVLNEQAFEFAQQWCMRRAFHAWSDRFMSVARAHALLKDANNASADAFAAARTQRLLGHCLAGWTAAVVVGQSARSAAEELLQRVWMQLMVADWRTTTVCSRGFKAAVMVAWREAVLRQQVDREAVSAADDFAAQTLLRKACRSWVVAWCRSASARVFAKQLQSKRQAAVFRALAANVQHQQHKRKLQQRADAFRRSKLLPLCVKFWRAWAVYKGVLGQASAAVAAAVRQRVLHDIMLSWREVAAFKVWERKALEGAESFYWCRLVASQFYCWRSYANRRLQLRVLADAAASQYSRAVLAKAWGGWRYQVGLQSKLKALQQQRQHQLMCEGFEAWWAESVGAKRAFEYQVSALVRLVTAAFKSWQFQAHQNKQLQQRLVTWQQQQQMRQQRRWKTVLQGWHQYTLLLQGWRSQAPLLAAAYYQERLIRLAWQAWRQVSPAQQQVQPAQQQVGVVQLPPQQQAMAGLQQSLPTEHQALAHQHQLLPAQQEVELSKQHVVQQQQAQQRLPSGQQQEEGQGIEIELSAVLLVERSQQMHQQPGFQAQPGSISGNVAVPVMALTAAALTKGNVATGGVCTGAEDDCTAVSHPPLGDNDLPAAQAIGSSEQPTLRVLSTTSQQPVDIVAWRDWQQQQQQQQLELLQATAASHHYAVRLARMSLREWAAVASAAAALMAAQAQLKHACQVALLQRHQHQQLVQQQRFERLVARPFRLWLQQAMLKRSAAVGFRCYNQLLRSFTGWRAVLLDQQQQLQGQQQVHTQDIQPRQHGSEGLAITQQPQGRETNAAVTGAAGLSGLPAAVVQKSVQLPASANPPMLQESSSQNKVLLWSNSMGQATYTDHLPSSDDVSLGIPWYDGTAAPQQHQQPVQHQQAALLPPWMLEPSHAAAAPSMAAAPSSGAAASGILPAQQQHPQQQQSVLDSLENVTCVQDLHNALLAMV